MAFRVAVIGDSAMWGQGLRREQTFAHLAATALAEKVGEPLDLVRGPGNEPRRGGARSGATLSETVPQIVVRETADGDLVGGLTDAQKVRNRFLADLPYLFTTDDERSRFLQGTDESPAARLYGENPSSFPTVADQIRRLGERGDDVDLVLLDGGINDVDFQGVLDPKNGPSLTAVLKVVERVFTVELNAALERARRAFPNAVIIVTGYFAALSRESDRGAVAAMFKHMSGRPKWQLMLNDAYTLFPLPFWLATPVFGALLAFVTDDVAELVDKAIERTIIASAHACHHIHRTVADFDVAGPDVVVAHPAFRPEHAVFASEPLVFEGYDVDATSGPTEIRDPQARRRSDSIPGRGLLNDYRAIGAIASIVGIGIDSDDERLRSAVRRTVSPGTMTSTAVRRAGERYLASPSDERARDLIEPAAREVARIERALMASFLHPNEKGAQRYSGRILTAWNRRQHLDLRSALAPDPDRRVSLDAVRRRLGAPPGSGLRRFAAVAFPDCLAVVVSGIPSGRPGRFRFSFGGQRTTDVAVGPNPPDEVLAAVECRDIRLVELDTLVVRRAGVLDDLPGLGNLDLGAAAPLPDLGRVDIHVNGRRMWSFRRTDAETDGDRLTFRLLH